MKTPPYWEQAKAELTALDSVIGQIIQRYHGETPKSRGDAFETLARSIVGQQISVLAADSVWKKVCLGLSSEVNPANVLATSLPDLRACGLSERKVIYLKDLARHFADDLLNPHRWVHMSDSEVIAELTQVKGIGVWTAEMFLIFHLLRPNVFPALDLGLQKAIALHYKVKYPLSDRNLVRFRKRYAPWASVATWYLWRSLDPVPVEY